MPFCSDQFFTLKSSLMHWERLCIMESHTSAEIWMVRVRKSTVSGGDFRTRRSGQRKFLCISLMPVLLPLAWSSRESVEVVTYFCNTVQLLTICKIKYLKAKFKLHLVMVYEPTTQSRWQPKIHVNHWAFQNGLELGALDAQIGYAGSSFNAVS